MDINIKKYLKGTVWSAPALFLFFAFSGPPTPECLAQQIDFKKVWKGKAPHQILQRQGDTDRDGQIDVIHFYKTSPGTKNKIGSKFQTLRDSDLDHHFETKWIFPKDPNILGQKEILGPKGNLEERTTFIFAPVSVRKPSQPIQPKGIWAQFEGGPERGGKKTRYFLPLHNSAGEGLNSNSDQEMKENERCVQKQAFPPVVKELEIFSREIRTIALKSVGEKNFFFTSFGYSIDVACMDVLGEKKLKDLLQNVFGQGQKCLESLNTPRSFEHLANFQLIRENKKAPPKIICSEENYDWDGIQGHASISEKDANHPLISLSPRDVKKGSVQGLSGLLFHESFHNFGHFHGDGEPDFCYACSACCFKEENEPDEVQKLGCEICQGRFPKGTRDPLYIKKMTDFFLKKDHTGPALDILFQSLFQNPNQLEGLLSLIKIYKVKDGAFLFSQVLAGEWVKMKSQMKEEELVKNLASSQEEISELLGEVEKKGGEVSKKFPDLKKSTVSLGQIFFQLIHSRPEQALGSFLRWKRVEIDEEENEDDYFDPIRLQALKDDLFLGFLEHQMVDKIFGQLSDLSERQELEQDHREVLEQMMTVTLKMMENEFGEEDRKKVAPFMEDYLTQEKFSKNWFFKDETRKKNYQNFMSVQ